VDLLVLAQMTLGAIADIAFAFAFGACVLAMEGVSRQRVLHVALIAWLAVQLLYLPLQASAMSGTALSEAMGAIPLVLVHSHFGMMWTIGAAGGAIALCASWVAPHATAWRTTSGLLLVTALIVVAFAHAGTTHAADAGDFSTAEMIHTVHLLATAGWAGAVICAAFPLRRWFVGVSVQSRANVARLSRIAALTFGIAIATGLANAYRGLGGSLAPLTSGLWGGLLVFKLVAVSCAVVIGAVNRLVHMRQARGGQARAAAAFMRLLTIEAGLMIVVLMAAAVLGHSIPAAIG
jgi:putative copper resistance protein D